MGKAIIILIVIAVLFYFIASKISKFKHNSYNETTSKNNVIEINLPTFMLQSLLKQTLITVGIGFLMLIVILVIASKFRIALLFLPISFYLIGQFFVFNNHLKAIKNQKITFNRSNNQLNVNYIDKKPEVILLGNPDTKLRKIKSVQKNNGLLMGYYEIITPQKKYKIPFLLAKNLQTKSFFDKLEQLPHEIEAKLFPII